MVTVVKLCAPGRVVAAKVTSLKNCSQCNPRLLDLRSAPEKRVIRVPWCYQSTVPGCLSPRGRQSSARHAQSAHREICLGGGGNWRRRTPRRPAPVPLAAADAVRSPAERNRKDEDAAHPLTLGGPRQSWGTLLGLAGHAAAGPPAGGPAATRPDRQGGSQDLKRGRPATQPPACGLEPAPASRRPASASALGRPAPRQAAARPTAAAGRPRGRVRWDPRFRRRASQMPDRRPQRRGQSGAGVARRAVTRLAGRGARPAARQKPRRRAADHTRSTSVVAP